MHRDGSSWTKAVGAEPRAFQSAGDAAEATLGRVSREPSPLAAWATRTRPARLSAMGDGRKRRGPEGRPDLLRHQAKDILTRDYASRRPPFSSDGHRPIVLPQKGETSNTQDHAADVGFASAVGRPGAAACFSEPAQGAHRRVRPFFYCSPEARSRRTGRPSRPTSL
jgi:hypothetical protein